MNSPFLLEFEHIQKNFGRLKASDNVSFAVRSGTIHALVGENGAGKSTLMKILFGIYQADSGIIKLRGQQENIKSPSLAKKLGLGMVHQHFMLAGPLTALDHVILDSNLPQDQLPLLAPLARKRIHGDLCELAEELKMPVDWQATIETLPIGIQQRIEILKLLYNRSDLLILDEPTAVLTPQEIEEFLERLRSIRAQGKTIILITHKLKEVFAVADEITVLRRGRSIRTAPRNDWSLAELTEAMIGEPLTETPVKASPYLQKNIQALEFTCGTINLKIQAGEILGIAGVEGNGQSELIRSLVAPLSDSRTKKVLIGSISAEKLSTLEIRKLGLGYLPEDRHSMAVALDSSLEENFLLGQHFRYSKWGFIERTHLRAHLHQALKDFAVRYDSIAQPLLELSGGNQQKLVVARELSHPLKVLVASHPTRGVDINSIQRIHQEILSSRDQGAGVLLVSSELEELMKLSDRILVLYRSQIVKEFKRADFEEKSIGAAMMGIET